MALWGGFAVSCASPSPPGGLSTPTEAGTRDSAGEPTDALGDEQVPQAMDGAGGASVIVDAAAPSDVDLDASRTPPDGEATPMRCSANVDGITVDERELAGYPSYAVDGCALAYVAGGPAELRMRDLASNREWVVANADELPRRPTVSGSGEVIAWEATIDGVNVVRVSYRGVVSTVRGSFDHAGEPRASADGVVFTTWATTDPLGDTDVALYLLATQETVPVVSRPSQQRFAEISETHIVFTDFAEDPDGHYDANSNDLADIGVYDRKTHEITIRALAGKQAFPLLLAGGSLAYLHWDWVEVHPEPKLAAYRLRVGPLAPVVGITDREMALVTAAFPPYVRPTAHGATLEWVDSPRGIFQLWRGATDSSSPPTAVSGLRGGPLYAPVATQTFTVLATRATTTAPASLMAVAR
jgi:hypothetical protein